MIGTFRLAVLIMGVVIASAEPVKANMIYELTTPSNNTDGAVLLGGFFETNGTFDTGITLGSILVDYEINFTDDSMSFMLTPSNSTVVTNSLLFEITPFAITIPTYTITDPGFQRFKISAGGGMPNINMSGGDSGFAFISVSKDESFSLSLVSQPLEVASSSAVIPEPSTVTLALLGAVGMLGYGWRRKRKRANAVS